MFGRSKSLEIVAEGECLKIIAVMNSVGATVFQR